MTAAYVLTLWLTASVPFGILLGRIMRPHGSPQRPHRAGQLRVAEEGGQSNHDRSNAA